MLALLLATRNSNKTREFRELLGQDFEMIDLNAFAETATLEETGHTFEENATIKAIVASQNRHLLAVADDSGLEVNALVGAPGIYSARYAGENASDRQNIDKLLRALETGNVPVNHRSARFRCVIALARDGQPLKTFEGAVEGTIVDPPRGRHGFGYDPIFQPIGFDRTFAELPTETKNTISHRAVAARQLREFLYANPLSIAGGSV